MGNELQVMGLNIAICDDEKVIRKRPVSARYLVVHPHVKERFIPLGFRSLAADCAKILPI
mgnify:CR=1 FL=1